MTRYTLHPDGRFWELRDNATGRTLATIYEAEDAKAIQDAMAELEDCDACGRLRPSDQLKSSRSNICLDARVCADGCESADLLGMNR